LRIPIISSVQELDRAPRKFLVFSSINLISWQCIIGAALVLFARKIDMPPSWVGVLLSFVPISSMFAVLTVPLVAVLGSKRLMFVAWTLRNVIVSLVFVMPWAVHRWGPRASWYVLLIAILGFCMARAIGAGGWLPWLHGLIPAHQRSTYFATESSLMQLVNVGVILAQALALHGNPGMGRYLAIYGAGIAAGLISMAWLTRVPGGDKTAGDAKNQGFIEYYRSAFRNRRYVRFVLISSLCFSCLSWFGSAFVMYMRDALELSSRNIMMVTACGSLGIMVTIRFWGRYAEHSGSNRAMGRALAGHALTALAALALVPGTRWAHYALAPTLVCSSIFGAAFGISANRAMLNRVDPQQRVGYTSLWQLGTAAALGITPILAGQVIERWGLAGFRACFVVSGLTGLGCALLCRFVIASVRRVDRTFAEMLSPLLPVQTVLNIASITIGLHESNRPGMSEAEPAERTGAPE